MRLLLPKTLDYTTFDGIVASGNDLNWSFTTIDMSQVQFIFPFGLNALLHIIDKSVMLEELIYPKNKVLSYMIRMGFFEQSNIKEQLSKEFSNKIVQLNPGIDESNNTLIEITRIKRFVDLFGILNKFNNKFENILRISLGYKDDEIKMFRDILQELCQNVSRHSKSVGFVSVQIIPFFKSYRWPLKIGITDTGIGFSGSYGGSISDEAAIQIAIDKNESSKEKGGLGYKNIKSHISKFGGELYVRSGTANYYQRPGENILSISSILGNLPYFNGSQIDVLLPNKRQLTNLLGIDIL